MALNKYIVQEGQSLYDVVLMKYGTLDELFTIFVANPSLTINDDLTALQEVYIDTNIVGEEDIKTRFNTTQYVTNNADENYTPIIDQKQFNDLTPFDFNDDEPYEFN
jgi:hypothetical protein